MGSLIDALLVKAYRPVLELRTCDPSLTVWQQLMRPSPVQRVRTHLIRIVLVHVHPHGKIDQRLTCIFRLLYIFDHFLNTIKVYKFDGKGLRISLLYSFSLILRFRRHMEGLEHLHQRSGECCRQSEFFTDFCVDIQGVAAFLVCVYVCQGNFRR